MTPLSRRAWLVLSFVVLLSLLGCERKDPSSTAKEAPKPALRVAVTTSTRDSGLLDVLVPMFERAHRCRVDTVAYTRCAHACMTKHASRSKQITHWPRWLAFSTACATSGS